MVDDILNVEETLRYLPKSEELSREIYTKSYQVSKDLKHLSKKINALVPIIETNQREKLEVLANDTTELLTHFSSWLKTTQSHLVSREAKRDFSVGGMNYGERKDVEAIQTYLWARGLDKHERNDEYIHSLLEQLRSYQDITFTRTFLSRFSVVKNNEYFSFNVLKVLGKILFDSGGFRSEADFRLGFRPLSDRVQINATVSLSMDIIEFLRYMSEGNVKKTYLHQA